MESRLSGKVQFGKRDINSLAPKQTAMGISALARDSAPTQSIYSLSAEDLLPSLPVQVIRKAIPDPGDDEQTRIRHHNYDNEIHDLTVDEQEAGT
jgi:hypothetical protein